MHRPQVQEKHYSQQFRLGFNFLFYTRTMLASLPLLVLARHSVFPSGYSPVFFLSFCCYHFYYYVLLCWVGITALGAEHNYRETNVRCNFSSAMNTSEMYE